VKKEESRIDGPRKKKPAEEEPPKSKKTGDPDQKKECGELFGGGVGGGSPRRTASSLSGPRASRQTERTMHSETHQTFIKQARTVK